MCELTDIVKRIQSTESDITELKKTCNDTKEKVDNLTDDYKDVIKHLSDIRKTIEDNNHNSSLYLKTITVLLTIVPFVIHLLNK